MASGDYDYTDDDSSSGFFPDDLDQFDAERDLYALLHINKDVMFMQCSTFRRGHERFLGWCNNNSASLSSFNSPLSSR